MNVFQRVRPYLAVAVLLGTAHCVFGHDTFQTTIIGKPNEADLEMRITLSAFGANNLLRQSGVTFASATASSFEEWRPKLVELAGKMLEVSVGDAPLSLTSAVVAPGEEGDVEFRLTYPRPAKRELQLHVAYLAQLGRGYSAELTLFNETGVGSILDLRQRDQPFIAWSLDSGARIMQESPVASTISQPAVVAVASLSGSVIHPAQPNPTSGQNLSANLTRKFPAVLILILVCLAGLTFWLTRRRLVH